MVGLRQWRIKRLERNIKKQLCWIEKVKGFIKSDREEVKRLLKEDQELRRKKVKK